MTQERGGCCSGLRIMDIFGGPPIFNINGNQTFKTIYGTILTVIFTLLILFIFAYYLYLYETHQTSVITTTGTTLATYPVFDFTKNLAPFSLQILDNYHISDIHVLVNRLINFNAYQYEEQPKQVGPGKSVKNHHMKMIPCDELKTLGRLPAKDKNNQSFGGSNGALMGSSKAICSDFSKVPAGITGFQAEGTLGSALFKQIVVEINPCSKSVDPKCLNGISSGGQFKQDENELLYKALSKKQIVLLFTESSIQSSNFATPILSNFNSDIRIGLDESTIKEVSLYFSEIVIKDYTGIFGTVVTIRTGVNFEKLIVTTNKRVGSILEDDVTASNKTQPPYIRILFKSSNQQTVIKREYMTFIGLLGKVGGLANALLFAFGILYYGFNKIRFTQYLVNEIILDDKSIVQSQMNGELDGQRNLRKFGFCEFFKMTVCKCCVKDKERLQLKEMAMQQLQHSMNITEIIKNCKRSNILFYSIFKNYQVRLLPYIQIEENIEEKMKQKNLMEYMSLQEAVEELNKNLLGGHAENDIQRGIDNYIYQNIILDKKKIIKHDGTSQQEKQDKLIQLISQSTVINQASKNRQQNSQMRSNQHLGLQSQDRSEMSMLNSTIVNRQEDFNTPNTQNYKSQIDEQIEKQIQEQIQSQKLSQNNLNVEQLSENNQDQPKREIELQTYQNYNQMNPDHHLLHGESKVVPHFGSTSSAYPQFKSNAYNTNNSNKINGNKYEAETMRMNQGPEEGMHVERVHFDSQKPYDSKQARADENDFFQSQTQNFSSRQAPNMPIPVLPPQFDNDLESVNPEEIVFRGNKNNKHQKY